MAPFAGHCTKPGYMEPLASFANRALREFSPLQWDERFETGRDFAVGARAGEGRGRGTR